MSTDRVTKLSTGQYDQVIAVTQYMMNTGLENLFDGTNFANDNTQDYTTAGQGFRDLVLGPPQVIFETLNDNHTDLYYRMHLKSGTFSCTMDKPKVKDANGKVLPPLPTDIAEIYYTVNDWYYTFRVDLETVVLDDDNPKKEDALRKLRRVAGKYTVQQMLVNMKTAKISVPRPESTSFGTWVKGDYRKNWSKNEIDQDVMKIGTPRDWSKEPKTVQKMFEFVIVNILDDFVTSDLQNLGITAEAADSGRIEVSDPGRPPTFVPVNCRFQMYPWTDPNDPTRKEVNSYDGNGQLNYLLYLEMTGNKDGVTPVSIPTVRFLEESGNWTDGRDPEREPMSKFGNFMLTKKKFLDDYLLPKFDRLNCMVKIDLSDLKADVWTEAITSHFSRDIRIAIGEGLQKLEESPQDQSYRFKPETDFNRQMGNLLFGAVFQTQLSPNALNWYWAFKDEPMRVHNDSRYKLIVYKCEHWGEADSLTLTRLSIEPGQNWILFEGWSTTRLYWEWDWDAVPNGKAELKCQVKWSVKMTMKEVKDGGLEFQIDHQEPKISFEGTNKGDLSWIENYMSSAYKTANANFERMIRGLKDSLKNQERFILPAAGVYFFKDPIFNRKGDLLCGLSYNGNTSLFDNPNEKAAARSAPGDTKLKPMPAGVQNRQDVSHEKSS